MKKQLLLLAFFCSYFFCFSQENTSTADSSFFSSHVIAAPLGSGYCVITLDNNVKKRMIISYYDKNMQLKWQKVQNGSASSSIGSIKLNNCGNQSLLLPFGVLECDYFRKGYLVINENGNIYGKGVKNLFKDESIVGSSVLGYFYVKNKQDEIFKIRVKDSTVIATFSKSSMQNTVVKNIVGINDSVQLVFTDKNASFTIRDDGKLGSTTQITANTGAEFIDLSKDFFYNRQNNTIYNKKNMKNLATPSNASLWQCPFIQGDSLYFLVGKATAKDYYNMVVYKIDSLKALTKVLDERFDLLGKSLYLNQSFKNEKGWLGIGSAKNAQIDNNPIANKLAEGYNDAFFQFSDSLKLLPLKQNIALKMLPLLEPPTYSTVIKSPCENNYLIKKLDFSLTNLGNDTIKSCVLKINGDFGGMFALYCNLNGGWEKTLKNITIAPKQNIIYTVNDYCLDPLTWTATERIGCFRVTAPNHQLDDDISDNADCLYFAKANNEVATQTLSAPDIEMQVIGDNIIITTDIDLQNTTIRVFDLAGRIVLNTPVDTFTKQVALPDLQKSMYIAVLFQDEKPLKQLKIVR